MIVAKRIVLSTVVVAVVVAGALAAVVVSRQRPAIQSARFYPEARSVVLEHCIQCHSEHNTVPAFPIAAGGIRLDTAEEMRRSAERIRVRAVVQQDMPLLNKTGMTADERAVLARWIEAGAAVPR